jgi:hypothetical protein
MRAVEPLRFAPDAIASGRMTRIDRYLDRADHARRGSWAPAPASTGLAGIDLALIDTTATAGEVPSRPDAATVWHVLWARPEGGGSVTIGAGDAAAWPIAPGDSVVAPPGMPLQAGGGQLAIALALPGRDALLAPPTHGSERYFGYNRLTTCCEIGDVRVCRWKLTQPLALAEHHPSPALVLALARTSVVRTASTIDILAQGELALVDPAADPVVTPDGLSYLLTIDRVEPADTESM